LVTSNIIQSVCLVGKGRLKKGCGLEPRTNFFRLRNWQKLVRIRFKNIWYNVYFQCYRLGIAHFHLGQPWNPSSEEYCCILPTAATVDKNNALVTSTLSQINLKSLWSHTQAVGDLYSEGFHFRSWPGNQLSWAVFTQSSSRQVIRYYIQSACMGETGIFILLYQKREKWVAWFRTWIWKSRGSRRVVVGNNVSVQGWCYHLHTSKMYGNTETEIRVSEEEVVNY